MTATVSIAKVSRPRIRDPVARPRLFDLLDACHDHPVIWICAPAGSGKTTLAASYLDNKKIKALWYQMDEGDGDPATFFYYMRLAAQKAAPRRKSHLPLLTTEYSVGIVTFTRRYFEALFSRLKSPCIIVLDNYQLIPERSSFHERLCQGLERVPEGITFMVLSRQEPPNQFSRLRANQHLHVVASDHIHFTLEESKAFFCQGGLEDLPETVISKVHEWTRGWVAGLALIMESLRIKSLDARSVLPFSTDEIFNYFTREIYDHLDAGTRQVLLKTAFLPKMTADMARHLTGSEQAKEILVRFSRSHFFTQRDAQPEPWYQYHPLFREFLLCRARNLMADQEVKSIYSAAAAVLEEGGQIDEAAAAILIAGDHQRQVDFLLRHAPALVNQGRDQVVLEWLKQIPPTILHASPWLLFWKVRSSIIRDPTASLEPMEKVYDLFTSRGDRVGQVMSCSAMLINIISRLADFSPLECWIGRLESHLQNTAGMLSPKIESGIATSMSAAMTWCLPHRCEAVRTWIDRSLELARRTGNADDEIVALHMAVLYYRRLQDRDNCAYFMARADESAHSRSLSPFARMMWRIAALAATIGSDKRPGAVFSSTIKALAFSQRFGIHVYDQGLLYLGGLYAIGSSSRKESADLLDRLAHVTPADSPRQTAMYLIVAAWHYLFYGEIPRALQMIRRMDQDHRTLDPYIHRMFHLIQVQVLWAGGKHAEALAQLAMVKKLAAQFEDDSHPIFESLVLEAQCFVEGENHYRGLNCLAKALAIAKKKVYDLHDVLMLPAVVSRLCQIALEHGLEVSWVQHFIRTSDIPLQPPPPDNAHWPWPIKIFTLGTFGIVLNDQPLPMDGLKKKPLLLLKALIAMGGQGVNVELLSDLLWPDAPGDAAYASFKMTLSRLRRMLQCETGIETHEGAISLAKAKVWVDTWAFESICSRAEDMESDHAALVSQAAGLYRGNFLPLDTDSWLISPREKYRDKYLRLILTAGAALERRECWEEAAIFYRSSLDTDDLAEKTYQRLMTCYARIGDKPALFATYTRLCKVLKARLNITPSHQSSTLYRNLMAK